MSRLETLSPQFLTRLSGFGKTPGPFGPIAAPFTQQIAERELFDSLIQELLDQQQPEFRPAPELGTFQMLNAEFARRFPLDLARRDVEVRRRQLGEPIPGPQSSEQELAAFEREIAQRRERLGTREFRKPLIDDLLALRTTELGRFDGTENARYERFLDQADDEQLAGLLDSEVQRRRAQTTLSAEEAVPAPIAAAGRLGRRAANMATFGASEAMITAGPTGARPLPSLIGEDVFGGTDILGEAFDQSVPGGVVEFAVEMTGVAAGLGVSGLARLASLVAAKLGITRVVAKRAIEGAVMMGVGETGSQVIKVPIEIAIKNKDAERASIEALQEIGFMTAGGAVVGGAFGAIEGGVKAVIGAVRAVRQPQGVRTPLREPITAEAPPAAPTPVVPVEPPGIAPEPPTTITRLRGQLPAPRPTEAPPGPPAEPAIAVPAAVRVPRETAVPQPEIPAVQQALPTRPVEIKPTITETGVPSRAQPHPERAGQEAIQAQIRPQTQAPARTQAVQALEPSRPGEVSRVPGPTEPKVKIQRPVFLAQTIIRIRLRDPQGNPLRTKNTQAVEVKVAELPDLKFGLFTEFTKPRRTLIAEQSTGLTVAMDTQGVGFGSALDNLQNELRTRGINGFRQQLAAKQVFVEQPKAIKAARPLRVGPRMAEPEPIAPVIEPIPGTVRPPGPPVPKPPAKPAEPPAPIGDAAAEREAQAVKEPTPAEEPFEFGTTAGPPTRVEPARPKKPAKATEIETQGQDPKLIKLAGKFLGEVNAGVPVDKVTEVVRVVGGGKPGRFGIYVPGVGIYARQIIRRVELQGGETGKVLARLARRFADRARQFEGRVAATRLAVEKRFRAKLKLRNRMQQLTRSEESNDAFFARTQLLVENRAVPEGVDEKFWLDQYRKLLIETGRMAEEVGAKVFTKGGGTRPFRRALGADKFIRVPTPPFRTAMVTHNTLFDTVVDELLKVNRIPTKRRTEAVEFLDQWLGPKAERIVGAIERARVFREFPTHVRHQGEIVQILETDPVSSLIGPAGLIPDRAAFIEIFGNNLGESGKVLRLRKQFVDAGGRVADFDNLISAMHDRPLSLVSGVFDQPVQPLRFGALQNAPLPVRVMIGAVNPIWRGLLLSSSVIPNIPEVIAKVPAHAGAGRLIRGIIEAARNPVRNKADLLQMGAITSDTVDFMLREGRKVEDFGRLGGNLLVRLFGNKFQNEANEIVAATVGRVLRDDIRRGGVGPLVRQRLAIMDYTPAEINQMATGKASQKLLDSIPGRVAAMTQGTTRKRVERSIAANDPLFKFVFDFQNYLQITVERGGRVLANLPQAYARGGVKELASATVIAVEFFAGQTLSGTGSLALRALVFGYAIDLGDDVVDWITRSLFESGVAGPLRTLEFVNPGDPSSDIIAKFSAKGRAMLDLMDAFRRKGTFANLTDAERVIELLRRQVPLHRAAGPAFTMTQSAYLVALGLRDPELGKARRRYFDWLNKNVPKVAGRAPGFNAFRREMRAAVTWLRADNPDRAFEAIKNAFKAAIEEETGSIPEGLDVESLNAVSQTVRNRIKSSILAQRLLPRVPRRLRAKLRKDIGERNFQLLELEDLILKFFADAKFVRQSQREAARERLKRKAG